jgi:hypothetical protein
VVSITLPLYLMGLKTQFIWVITPTLQEHLRSPQEQTLECKIPFTERH